MKKEKNKIVQFLRIHKKTVSKSYKNQYQYIALYEKKSQYYIRNMLKISHSVAKYLNINEEVFYNYVVNNKAILLNLYKNRKHLFDDNSFHSSELYFQDDILKYKQNNFQFSLKI